MSNPAILCFLKEHCSNKTLYSKFIRKIPRIGEEILINDEWIGKVIQIKHRLYENDTSHIIYIYLET